MQARAWGDGVLAIAYLVWLEVGGEPTPDDAEEMAPMAREEFIESARLRTSWVLRVTRRAAKDTAIALRRRRSGIVLAQTLDVIGAAGILLHMQGCDAESQAWSTVFAAWEARGVVDAHIATLTGSIREQLVATAEQQRSWLVDFQQRLPEGDAFFTYGGR